ncbi:hypothetical protein DFJ74DRAFT_767469 [Hyaloraphidium curvatum]|nr:hypothetical protein DFJ74DRAFT_767469 [Hyaloraphidium curvatum]
MACRVEALAAHLQPSNAYPHPVRLLDEPELVRRDLRENGFAAVRAVTDAADIQALQNGLWDFFEGTNPSKISRTDPSTWAKSNWPLTSRGLCHRYHAGHSDVAWKGRTHPGVRKAFEIVWGTHELITSYDAVGMMRPPEVLRELGEQPPPVEHWPHIDHDEEGEEVELVQGFLNLWESGPDDGGLVQWLGSGPAFPEKWPAELHEGLKGARIIGRIDQGALDRSGFRRIKACGPPGTLFLWMSTQIHCNEAINPLRSLSIPRPRGGLYICMCPRRLVRPSQLYSHALAYRLRITTGHRPYRVVGFRDRPRVPPGEVDPIDWDGMKQGELEETEEVLRLAGVLPYPGGEGEAWDLEAMNLSKLDIVWQG